MATKGIELRGIFRDLPPESRFAKHAPTNYLDRNFLDPARIQSGRQRLLGAAPAPHLVMDGLFDEELLDAVSAEFDTHGEWRTIENAREKTVRCHPGAGFGPATEIYLALVNSAYFVGYLKDLTEFPHLIADVTTERAGPHQTNAGGFFEIHKDFSHHKDNDLSTTLLVMTYLSRDWKSEYGGELELWQPSGRVTSIEPKFARTVILPYPNRVLHGVPTPLRSPPDVARRSIASYYYMNRRAVAYERASTQFLDATLYERSRHLIRRVIPERIRVAASSLKRK